MDDATPSALSLARAGAVDAAVELLAAQGDALTSSALTMLFLLVEEDGEHAIELCRLALARPLSDVEVSTWHLRRGLIYARRGARDQAMADLLRVIGKQASDSQVQEAQRAMLRLASSP